MGNIAFNGNCHDKNGDLITDIAYRLYFNGKNASSSPDTWSDIRYSEPGLNQYNINLFDPDILGNEGVALAGDEVIILYWQPNTVHHTSTVLTEWGAISYVLSDVSTFPQDIQIVNHHNPTCSFDFNGAYVNEDVFVLDIGSTDDYYWTFSSKSHFQEYTQVGEILFEKNKIPDAAVQINWGDGTIDTNLNLYDAPFQHQYTAPDDYEIYITLENSDLLECNQGIPVHIVNNVYNGLTWNPPVCLNDDIEYTPNITGETASISGVDYYIDSVLTFTNLAWDESFIHSFNTGGTHNIRQCIKYNDGFIEQEKCSDNTVIMCLIAHYEEFDYECGLRFESNSQVGSPPVITYQWDVTYNGDILAHVEGPEYHEWYYSFPFLGTFRVRFQIQDQYNTSSYEREYNITECAGSSPSNGGGADVGGAPWIYQESKPEILPKITIIGIDDCAITDKKILIVDVIDVKDLNI